jgi:uncharacterized protein YbjT (DUF2867 family)/uncharacterized protein YndB with AHSA1/START domain
VNSAQPVLVAGSTGYVGRHLIPALLARGCLVRCLARQPGHLASQPWFSQVEVVQGDVFQRQSLDRALEGVSTAYYLIHNMTSGDNYSDRDLVSAHNFARAASRAGVAHIIYLGGLADPDASIGGHLRSRIQTGDALRQGDVPVTEFRSSIVIGPGATAFELIRYLTEQLPLLPAPRWVSNHVQPIAIQDVIDYLLAALERHPDHNAVYEIGGADSMTFAESMLTYARLRGLKRQLVKLPVLPLPLMAFFAAKLTPVPASMARPLIDGMRGDSVVQEHAASRDFPHVRLTDYPTMVQASLSQLTPEYIDPLVFAGRRPVTSLKHQGFLIDKRKVRLDLPPEPVYRAFTHLGGKAGWLYLNSLWKIRGWLDRLLGGPGMRGRQGTDRLQVGDVVDYYTVDALQPEEMLRLRADLKAPGLGWMEWRVDPHAEGGVTLTQIAYFAPKGLPGFLYWYLLSPIHRLVFAGLVRRIARKAEEIAGGERIRTNGRI